MNTDTPRTAETVDKCCNDLSLYRVSHALKSLSEQLERELTAAKGLYESALIAWGKDLEKLTQANARADEALAIARGLGDNFSPSHGYNCKTNNRDCTDITQCDCGLMEAIDRLAKLEESTNPTP